MITEAAKCTKTSVIKYDLLGGFIADLSHHFVSKRSKNGAQQSHINRFSSINCLQQHVERNLTLKSGQRKEVDN